MGSLELPERFSIVNRRLLAFVLCACCIGCGQQIPAPQDKFARAMVDYRQHLGSQLHWSQVIDALGLPDTVEQGYRLQKRYVDLRASDEKRAGYKVALGSPSSQALLGASEPILGVLFKRDLKPSGARINRQLGIVLAVEADLLVTVGSENINSARTVEDVAQSIESLHAYIELPDLPFPFASDVAPRFTASNAGAHLGIVGSTVKASASTEFINQLANMQVVLSANSPGEQSKQLASAAGDSLMLHPYNAVLFLLRKIANDGGTLQKGDVISLGAYSKPTPIKMLMSEKELAVSIRYLGLLDHKTGKTASATVYFD
ncbi:MAG: 2-keto-4-pentenoate hydratase [Pseudomonadales bacterium]